MNDIFGFSIEGETIDGDLICEYWEYENAENATDALTMAEKNVTLILTEEGGGHVDIFDEDGVFLTDVEV